MGKIFDYKWLIAAGVGVVIVGGFLVWLLTGGLETKNTPVASSGSTSPTPTAKAKPGKPGEGNNVPPNIPHGKPVVPAVPTTKPAVPARYTATAKIVLATQSSATVKISGTNVGGTASMPTCVVTIQGANTTVPVNSTVYPNQAFTWTAFKVAVGDPATKPTSASVSCS